MELCSPIVYAKFGGQTDCTCITWQEWQSAISTGSLLGGGGVWGRPPPESFEL